RHISASSGCLCSIAAAFAVAVRPRTIFLPSLLSTVQISLDLHSSAFAIADLAVDWLHADFIDFIYSGAYFLASSIVQCFKPLELSQSPYWRTCCIYVLTVAALCKYGDCPPNLLSAALLLPPIRICDSSFRCITYLIDLFFPIDTLPPWCK